MPVAAILSSLLLGLADPQSAPQAQTTVPDITVTGRPTAEAVRDFVGRIAAPVRGRGLAQWNMRVCPGVVNLSRDASQAIIDRITTVAAGLDIPTGDPGCAANLVIIFTTDGPGVAQALVASEPDVFAPNVTGVDRGPAALDRFQQSDAPVRWWSLSLPVDSETGLRAVRVPGQFSGRTPNTASTTGSHFDYGPQIAIQSPSRVDSQIVDALFKTIVIVDMDTLGQVDTIQLGDYLAFVSLAQIDPRAETTTFDTVLNLFDGGGQAGLTDWDRSYLQALYAPRSQRASPSAQASAVAAIMTGDRRAAARAE